jgi:general secretion pathway protein L
MALEADNWRLFGVDLQALPRLWRKGWDEALGWPAFAWLSPQEPVRVLLPDGDEVLRLGASASPASPAAAARTLAVVLPDSAVLIRELVLPPLARGELREALGLEVAAVSPFPPEQAAWGWRAEAQGDRLRVRLALAARAHVAAHLERLGERLGGAQPEVWADAASPIVLNGYAEAARGARLAGARRRIVAVLATTTVLILALAATPILQTRQRLLDAQTRYAQVETETAGLVAARNTLALANERARAVRAHLAERPDVLQLIETLTATLPDDAYLTRLEIDGRKVRIAGQAGNASQLMNMLGARPAEFREVRAPSPISRVIGADKESFVIEFVLAAKEEAQ